MEITAANVKELRNQTGAGVMECKRALVEARGNIDAAIEILRRQGLDRADRKAGRPAQQGVVDSYIHAGGRIGAMVEVNCETDFVARTDDFRRLAHDIAHELGHAYDATYLSAPQRASYLATRSRNSANWWPGLRAADYTANAVTDYGSGAGDFAEVFALCHAPSPEFRSTLAPRPPDPCALIPLPRRPAAAATRPGG